MSETMPVLLEAPQGKRFERAAEQERLSREGLRFALRRALAEGLRRRAGRVRGNTLARSLVDIGQRALSSSTQHVRHLQPYSVAVIVSEFIGDPIPMQTFRLDVARGVDGQFPTTVQVPLVNGGSNYIVVPSADGSQFGTAALRSVARVESLTAGDMVGIGRFAPQVTVDIPAVTAAFGTASTMRLSLRLPRDRLTLSYGTAAAQIALP